MTNTSKYLSNSNSCTGNRAEQGVRSTCQRSCLLYLYMPLYSPFILYRANCLHSFHPSTACSCFVYPRVITWSLLCWRFGLRGRVWTGRWRCSIPGPRDGRRTLALARKVAGPLATHVWCFSLDITGSIMT